MKILRAILAAFVLAIFILIEAAKAQSEMERQAQCELAAIRDTRSAVAIQSIRSACNWFAINSDFLLNDQNEKYYRCLLQNLSGAQSDAAAEAIISACRTANPL